MQVRQEINSVNDGGVDLILTTPLFLYYGKQKLISKERKNAEGTNPQSQHRRIMYLDGYEGIF